MSPQIVTFILAGGVIHFTVFFLIVGKAVFNTEWRVDYVGLPLWVILSIGILWPLTLVAIVIFVAYLFSLHRSS